MNRRAPRTLFTLAALVAAGAGLSGRAQALERTPSGVSVDVGLEQNYDGSVTEAGDGAGAGYRSGHLDANALGNLGNFAFGAGFAFAPNILGDGRLLLGARAGWQPLVGASRIHFLGEAGWHRFEDVGGNLFAHSTPSVFDTPYLGADVGLTRSFGRLPVEYGVSVHVRQDLGHQTVVNTDSGISLLGTAPEPTVTEYNLGGTMVGVSLTIGFRAESHRPAAVLE